MARCPPGTVQVFSDPARGIEGGCAPVPTSQFSVASPEPFSRFRGESGSGAVIDVCRTITNPVARAACELAARVAGFDGGGGGGDPSGRNIFEECVLPWRRDPITMKCVLFAGEQPGPEPGGRGGGAAVMGRYGAGYTPDVDTRVHLGCLPGDVLGTDSICYPKKSLTNKERKYPRGRRPLLTGGEMRAISIASGAARRVARTQKRLQKMGMLPKPAPRKAAPKQKLIGGPGITVIDTE